MICKDLAAEFNFRSKTDRKKKNEQIIKMMRTIETIQSEYGMDQASALAAAGISASSSKRWKRRIRDGVDPVQKPGAKKVNDLLQELLVIPINALDMPTTMNLIKAWSSLIIIDIYSTPNVFCIIKRGRRFVISFISPMYVPIIPNRKNKIENIIDIKVITEAQPATVRSFK